MSKISSAPVMQSPLHAFGLAAKAKPIDASCGVWANEIALLGYISLRGNPADAAFLSAASKALGTDLPVSPCTLAQSGETVIAWLSPDEWIIFGPRAAHAALLKGIRSQVTGNSGGFTQVMIQGRNAREVLSHCTVYDLDHLSQGRIVGTTFGKTSAYVRRAGDGYCLLFRRSFADYIWLFLERAAQPYGLGIAKLDSGIGAKS